MASLEMDELNEHVLLQHVVHLPLQMRQKHIYLGFTESVGNYFFLMAEMLAALRRRTDKEEWH